MLPARCREGGQLTSCQVAEAGRHIFPNWVCFVFLRHHLVSPTGSNKTATCMTVSAAVVRRPRRVWHRQNTGGLLVTCHSWLSKEAKKRHNRTLGQRGELNSVVSVCIARQVPSRHTCSPVKIMVPCSSHCLWICYATDQSQYRRESSPFKYRRRQNVRVAENQNNPKTFLENSHVILLCNKEL